MSGRLCERGRRQAVKIILLRSFTGKRSKATCLRLKENVDVIVVLKAGDIRAGVSADGNDPVERKEVMM